MSKRLRNDSTPKGKRIWKNVDDAAKGAPQWVRDRLNGTERGDEESPAQQDPGEKTAPHNPPGAVPHHCPVCGKHFCYETPECRAWWRNFWREREGAASPRAEPT